MNVALNHPLTICQPFMNRYSSLSKRKITIELDEDLFIRFERCCEERSRQKAGQIRAMISDWVQAQETPLSVPLLPGPRGQFEDYCRRHQIAPHVWLAMQIQRVIRG